MQRKPAIEFCVLLGLVGMGVWLRLALESIPNFAPVAAMALFAGYYFRKTSVALAVPISIMMITDWYIGGYQPLLMISVYSMLAMPVALRGVLRTRLPLSCRKARCAAISAMGLVGCSLISSVLFFLVTNFTAWMVSNAYAKTWAGFVSCYVNAVPFFRYTFASDAAFAFLLFGGYAIVLRTQEVIASKSAGQADAIDSIAASTT